jgi:DinB superfamily
MDDLNNERYPVGRVPRNKKPLTEAARADLITVIDEAPGTLRALVTGLTDSQLDTRYRTGGWTIRQVIHHLPDSHMNAYVRMKLAATETAPLIKTYDEALWAELPEARTAPVGISLDLLDALHRRWVAFLTALPHEAFDRTFSHPDWGLVTLDESLGMYAWHCRHHTAHVQLGIQRAR